MQYVLYIILPHCNDVLSAMLRSWALSFIVKFWRKKSTKFQVQRSRPKKNVKDILWKWIYGYVRFIFRSFMNLFETIRRQYEMCNAPESKSVLNYLIMHWCLSMIHYFAMHERVLKEVCSYELSLYMYVNTMPRSQIVFKLYATTVH